MRITDIEIDHYGPLSRFTHTCEPSIEVFYGPNESGKTLLMEAILKLLDSEISAVLPGVSRVDGAPRGHVGVELNGTRQQFSGKVTLGDVSAISPHHLRNIFVIRDSDLALHDEHEFYDAVTEQIGDLHTSEIDAIQSRLVERGRLTSVSGRSLSSAKTHDDAAEVRDATRELQSDIQSYIQTTESNEIDEIEREYLSVTSKLQRCRSQLERQEAAKILDTYTTLSDRLETLKNANEALDENIDESTYDELMDIEREIESDTNSLNDLKDKLGELREERSKYVERKESLEAEISRLESRDTELSRVEDSLESFRASYTGAIGASRGMQFAKLLAVTGFATGGVAAVFGSIVTGIILTILGVVAGGWYLVQHRSLKHAEQSRERAIRDAQDAGLDVTTIDDIAPAISDIRDDLSRIQHQTQDVETKIELQTELSNECRENIESARRDRQLTRSKKMDLLRDAGVSDLDEYQDQLLAKKELEQDCEKALQSLKDALGISGEGSETQGNIRYWTQELAAMKDSVDMDVSADEYDPEELAVLEEDETRLRDRRERLSHSLEEHTRQLREFEERVQKIPTESFSQESVTLKSLTIDGLEKLTRDLNHVIEAIEREADVAREALGVFDEIKAEEEQKITDLFGEGSRATTAFSEMTYNRYMCVVYDVDEKKLKVHRENGTVLTARELSHGTRDQLYLAARIGLAEQLLNSQPGFFLFDDAFLPADRTRLREGFNVLCELAESGWQILYFTAKEEVGVDIVNELNLECRTFDSLP